MKRRKASGNMMLVGSAAMLIAFTPRDRSKEWNEAGDEPLCGLLVVGATAISQIRRANRDICNGLHCAVLIFIIFGVLNFHSRTNVGTKVCWDRVPIWDVSFWYWRCHQGDRAPLTVWPRPHLMVDIQPGSVQLRRRGM